MAVEYDLPDATVTLSANWRTALTALRRLRPLGSPLGMSKASGADSCHSVATAVGPVSTLLRPSKSGANCPFDRP